MDWIEGTVTDVGDGGALEVTVKSASRPYHHTHGKTERVRIVGTHQPDPGTTDLWVYATRLRSKFRGKPVHCDIWHRDESGALVCSVRILSPGKA